MVIVAAAASALAVHLYLDHLAHARVLWYGPFHDRNGHYGFAVALALALRDLDLPRVALDVLVTARVWPPLHGLLLAPILALFGPDYRLAGLVSLAGWVATVVGCFAVARRAAVEPLAGLLAGMGAAAWAASSPELRAYAVDAMLESLGAALTVLTLYLYLRLREDPTDPRRWSHLGAGLTLLFFEKANYWLLVVIALALSAASLAPARLGARARAALGSPALRSIACAGFAHPLVYAALTMLAAVAALYARGPTSVHLFGCAVSLFPPENLLSAGYALLFVRAAQLWRQHRVALAAAVPTGLRCLFAWHVAPVAVSFLVPKRLAAFLWYVGPLHYAEVDAPGLRDAALRYLDWAVQDYHSATWSALVVALLTAVALIGRRRWAAGTNAVFLLAAVGMILVVLHPNQKARFLHSWIAAWWIAAGLGCAWMLTTLGRSRVARSVALAAGALLVLALLSTAHWPARPDMTCATAGACSDLDITDAYLDAVGRYHRVAVLSTFDAGSLFRWTYMERHRRRDGIETVRLPVLRSPDDARRAFARWLDTTQADAVVLIASQDPDYELAILGHVSANTAVLAEAMAGQRRFRLTRELPTRAADIRITLWTRDGG